LQKNLKLEGRGGGLKKAFKARWKKSSTKKHAEELFALEQSMQTQILAYSWIRDQAVEAEQEQGFKNVDTQIQTFVRQVVAGHTKLEGLLQKEATVIKTHTTTEAAKIRDHVTAETSKTTDRLAQESGLQERKARLAKLLASLEYPEMNARRNQSSIDAYEDTFQWIFEENEKRAWDSFPSFLTSQDQTLYWISGKPGAGKSTLMKFLVQHDRTTELLERWSSNPLTVSYFFWLRGSPMQRSTKGLLSSLVRQILDSQSNTPNFPLNSNVWSKQSINDWSSQELQQLLLQCLTTTNRPVCLFLDGLDEMDQKEDSFDLIALIHKISNQKHTKVCLASRPERLFHNQYSSSPTMRLQDLTEPDIRHYVSQQLGNYTSNSQSDNGKKDREKLVQLVVEKAQGVFLWVYLVLRSLRRGIEVRNDDWDVLIRRVKEKPSDLDHLYKDMLTRLGNEMNLYQHEAAFYFAFVLDDVTTLSQLTFANSKRPQNVIDAGESLPPLEILNSECERRQRQVEDYSAGLLEVTKWQILDISLQNLREEVDRLCECQWARFQIIASRKPGDDVFAFQTLLHLRRYTANCRQEVRFIHRTAADFLLNTTEGQGILASYHAAAGEIKVKRSESEAFAWLAGSGAPISYLLHAKNWVLEGVASKDSKWKQLGHLKLWFDKMFYSYLGDLENLRGSKLCYTTKLLYETAKETVAQYITNLGQFGELSAIKKYVEYTEALGYQLTNDFSSFVLFKTIQWHHEDWGTCHRDVISYLLKLGADPNDSTREWSWFSMNLIPPAYQKQSALEVFIYNILNLSYQDSDDMPHLATAAVSLAATLKDLLEHKPNLERRILYEIFIKGKTPTTDPIKSSRSIHVRE
jgi:hypothetical protein